VTVLWQSFDLQAGPSPSDKVSLERKKKNTALRWRTRAPRTLAGIKGLGTNASLRGIGRPSSNRYWKQKKTCSRAFATGAFHTW
jgi:hypothetical protein